MNKHHIALSPILVAAALFSAPVSAQQAAPAAFVGITSGGQISAEDRIASSDSRQHVTSAQISNENDVLTANFAFDLTIAGDISETRRNGAVFYTSSLSNFSVKASVPLNPSKKGSVVDFKTFGNDGKLTLGFNFYRSKLLATSSGESSYVIFARTCIVEAGAQWRKDVQVSSRTDIDAQISSVLGRFDSETQANQPLSASLFRAAKQTPDDGFGPFALSTCQAQGTGGIGSYTDYATKYGEKTLGKEGYAAWRQRYFDPQASLFIGAEASLGYNRFSVVDRPSLTIGVKDRVGFDLNGHVGGIFGNSGLLVLASAGYTRTYKAKDTVDVCGPPDATGKSVCINGQDGLPARNDTGYAAVSVRKVLFTNKDGEPIIGVRPSVTFVLEDHAFQFELPVYMQRSSTGGLDAGVRALYNTGSRKFGLGAFVGVPF
ncbi:MAG: hypothetical protein QFC78_07005 [Pseudomonadota bacterium]|nr:hypothetical protein [Pseudomonadota bacterium]